jgi:hypothetical protein
VEGKAREILRVTGEEEGYFSWWCETIRRAEKDPLHLEVLVESVNRAIVAGDPVKRQAKDVGKLERPGAFIAGALRDAGMRLPPPPAVRAGGSAGARRGA